jgi:hypothetical protein
MSRHDRANILWKVQIMQLLITKFLHAPFIASFTDPNIQLRDTF